MISNNGLCLCTTCAVHCTHVLLLIFLALVINFDLLKILVATLLHSAHSYVLLFGWASGWSQVLVTTHPLKRAHAAKLGYISLGKWKFYA